MHYKLYLLKLTMAVDNFVFRIIKGALFGHQPLVVYVCVSECIIMCVRGHVVILLGA